MSTGLSRRPFAAVPVGAGCRLRAVLAAQPVALGAARRGHERPSTLPRYFGAADTRQTWLVRG